MQVTQTLTFKRQSKKIHVNEKIDLDNAIRKIISDPEKGEMKKGDLSGVRIYKFKMQRKLTLIAYEILSNKKEIVLLTFGSHENFYRDLKH
jgi:mRNA-degrading endonuclease RelE of RelBE toxin-antitoxin system